MLERMRVFTVREWRRHSGRTMLSLAVMAISAALLVAVFGIAGSITGSSDRLVAGISGNASLEVSGVTDTGFTDSVRDDVAAVPGVAAAVPMLRTSVGPAAERVVLLGVDESLGAMTSDLQRAVQDQLGRLATEPDSVAVGTGTGHHVGDSIVVGDGHVTVGSVLSGADAERINGGNFILGSLPLLQRLTDRADMIDSVLVVTAPNADLATVRMEVTDAVAGRAIVTNPAFRSEKSSGAVSIMSTLLLSAASCALAVAGFLMFNALSMAISQRRPLISLVRAIGAKRQQIVRDLLLEAGLVGLVGGILGSALGVLIGRQAIAGLPPGLLQGLETRTDFILPGYAIPVALVACIAVSVAAAALAARQVYKVAPAEALAPVGISVADRIPRTVRVVAGVIGVVCVVAAAAVAASDLGTLSVGAIGLAVVGEVAVCFAFAGAIVRAAAAAARTFGSSGALAAATIERAPRRVWATLMTVLIAVSVTVQTTGSNTNAIDSTNRGFAALANTAFYVSPSPAGVLPTAPVLPADTQSAIESIPGVADVVPSQMAFATLGDNRVVVQGITSGEAGPPSDAMDPQVLQRMLAGDGVVVSREVARDLRIEAGDELTLPTPTGERRVEVLEVVPYFSLFGGLVSMSLTDMRDWFDRPGETILAVTLLPGADPAAVEAAIADRVSPDVLVLTGAASLAAIGDGMKSTTALIDVIAWIVVFVAGIALFNTLMLAVLERRRELGVLRAMGASRRFVLRTVLAEAAGMDIVGAAIGAAFGALNQYLSTAALANVIGVDVAYAASGLAVVFACGAFALTLFGALPPALRAARIDIVDAVAVD